ncbi:carbohydrate binding domain-containing protein [Flavobacterium sp. HJJ]|uniref:carbohydrate binding domain-containing protein n=1 Tax=Flavobacterium sp. HJJ TaxID=2783792 RepID=UPI00188AB14F|nr:carbohydrate binding domain-containing protein [Flavobacterium sp. HJJ]MBF4472872.1 carbohydrate binding domain-containing protein [Flavobacterium sp. HJJ]
MKAFLVLSLIFITVTNNAQTNLIKNAGFETDLLNWRGEENAAISPYDKKSGKNSCTITQYVGAEWKAVDQITTIPKNTAAIELSGWIKTEGVEKGKNDWNTGKFDIEFLNSGEKGIKNESIASVLGTTPWSFYKKIIAVPAGASKLRVMLALGQTNGTIFFDDIKAVAITQEQMDKIQQEENAKNTATASGSQTAVLTNTDFENGTASWRGNAAVSTAVFKEGKAALVLNSAAFDWTGIDQIAAVPDNAVSITISGWLKSDAIKQGKDPWNNGLFSVEFTGTGDQKTGDQNIAFVTATTDWTYYTKTFTLPAGTKKYRIMLALGFASGTLYADALSVDFK